MPIDLSRRTTATLRPLDHMKQFTSETHSPEETRFQFGRNWRHFLDTVDETAIDEAETSLREALQVEDLNDKSFLDIGSGSGLFSLAAWRMGATVHSIDLDRESVECTRELKRRYAEQSDRWQIELGSALDEDTLSSLEQFDVVYSWGVLHHTGAMWRAIENAIERVAERGQLFIAIYNDQGPMSTRWKRIKRGYNLLPSGLRFMLLVPAFCRIWGPTMIRDLLRLRPMHTWRNYRSNRGMNAWYDFVDWVGGFPFEVATPDEVFEFCRERGFKLTHLKTCGAGRGCNEFVFVRESSEKKAP